MDFGYSCVADELNPVKSMDFTGLPFSSSATQARLFRDKSIIYRDVCIMGVHVMCLICVLFKTFKGQVKCSSQSPYEIIISDHNN